MAEYLMRFQAIKNIKEIFILVEKTVFWFFFSPSIFNSTEEAIYTNIYIYVDISC